MNASAPLRPTATRPPPGAVALVVGLGVSGEAAAEALLRAGWRVRVADTADTPAVRQRAAALRTLGAEVIAQPASPDTLLDGCALVVPSPGVPPVAPLPAAAAARGIEVISEPELAWRLRAGATRLVAVTGTNGKTSTTELLAACLGAPAAGNIGLPLTRLLSDPDAPPLAVAELSSFQLHFTSSLAPDVGVVLNLAPDHLDWHRSFVAYAAAKARIWRAQTPGQIAVVNGDDREAAGLVDAFPPPGQIAVYAVDRARGRGRRAFVEGNRIRWDDGDEVVDVLPVTELARARPHDISNVLAAVTAAVAAGADPRALAVPLRAYRPGRHRLELVGHVAGVDYVNDSKATNPHAAAAALSAFSSVVWIAGGLNKGLTFDDLAPLLPGRVRATVTIGTSGPALAAVSRGAGVPAVEAGTLDAAVTAAANLACAGDTVLLAPACASMDQFSDYAARGDAFREAVARLAAGNGTRAGGTNGG